MNFDWLSIDWFTTVPGLLITGGVLLLLIALLIFLLSIAKSKKKDKFDEKFESKTDIDALNKNLEQVSNNMVQNVPIKEEIPNVANKEGNKVDSNTNDNFTSNNLFIEEEMSPVVKEEQPSIPTNILPTNSNIEDIKIEPTTTNNEVDLNPEPVSIYNNQASGKIVNNNKEAVVIDPTKTIVDVMKNNSTITTPAETYRVDKAVDNSPVVEITPVQAKDESIPIESKEIEQATVVAVNKTPQNQPVEVQETQSETPEIL